MRPSSSDFPSAVTSRSRNFGETPRLSRKNPVRSVVFFFATLARGTPSSGFSPAQGANRDAPTDSRHTSWLTCAAEHCPTPSGVEG